jgi:hypothetical protein
MHKEPIMNEIIVEATGLPLKFPDPAEEAYARAQEYRALSPKRRLASLLDVIEMGRMLMRHSPKRDIIDQLFLKREAEWQRIQQELFRNGK